MLWRQSQSTAACWTNSHSRKKQNLLPLSHWLCAGLLSTCYEVVDAGQMSSVLEVGAGSCVLLLFCAGCRYRDRDDLLVGDPGADAACLRLCDPMLRAVQDLHVLPPLGYGIRPHAYIAAFQDGEPLIAYCAGPAHRGSGVPRAQRLCQRCNLHAVHDERQLVFECPAMQCVRIGTLPCSVLLKTPCSCLCGSATFLGWRNPSRTVLRCLVP